MVILMDACSGFHQIPMEKSSSQKTAFVGPFGRKYQYKVMSFGIINGSTIYVIAIYDLREHWNSHAIKQGIQIGKDINTRIIIDDTLIHTVTHKQGLDYLRSILEESKRYNLSWKLSKCSFF